MSLLDTDDDCFSTTIIIRELLSRNGERWPIILSQRHLMKKCEITMHNTRKYLFRTIVHIIERKGLVIVFSPGVKNLPFAFK